MLYLGTTVLILFDLSYLSRFWTQFEAWLSMQFATPNGLKSAVGTENARYHIVCIQGAAEQAEQYKEALVDTWADKTPQQAFDFLSRPDVTVTNQSDKLKQLPKIKALDATVQGAFQAIDAQLLQRVAANAAAVELALSELQKVERECREATARAEAECRAAKARADAKVVPLAEVMTRAEGEAAAARAAKQTHAQAIKHGVMPIVMERAPPGLKMEGGSLRGKATEYMGLYMLDGLVNGRPAWKHTNGSCWIAFDGANWRGQLKAHLGQKRGVLMLTDADAASPDASSATWQASAGEGSALAAQPALVKCTVATAAELSAAQAAAALRAEEEQRAKAAAQAAAELRAKEEQRAKAAAQAAAQLRAEQEQRAEAAAQAAAELRAKEEQRAKAAAAREVSVKNFRGPCADCCKPLAPCCCVSADGEAIFCCVPTEPKYFLPACLHMALCPQLGCDPRGGDEEMVDYFIGPFISTLCCTPFVVCIQGKNQEELFYW
jgi:hypothetical protein